MSDDVVFVAEATHFEGLEERLENAEEKVSLISATVRQGGRKILVPQWLVPAQRLLYVQQNLNFKSPVRQ